MADNLPHLALDGSLDFSASAPASFANQSGSQINIR
jgi:hypothetical protein